jgi:hypothetical protein
VNTERQVWYEAVILILGIACLVSGVVMAQQDKAIGATNTQLPGYDSETNPNRSGIVSVTLHKNRATFYLDGVIVGRDFNYCHYDGNGSLHPQGFEYTNAAYTMYVSLENEDNTLDVYLDDVLIASHPDWCQE